MEVDLAKKHPKAGKGKAIRPCHVCGAPVNFVLWGEETKARGRRIFHWANPDGSHHLHKLLDNDFELIKAHLRSIMEEE